MNEQYLQRFLNARRTYISSQFSSLNPQQQEAVLTTEGPLLLLAGAGSGKTTVLINRVANLLRFGRASDTAEVPANVTEEDVEFLESVDSSASQWEKDRADYLCAVEPVAPWNILAITFTNKAANELKERLSLMIGPEAENIWAMTFHSACCRILRRECERLGFSRNFTIYDSSDSERIMKEILREMGIDDKVLPAKYVLSLISKEKDAFQSPADLEQRAALSGDYRMKPIVRAYASYQKRLKENNALDFDDLIFQTVVLLNDFEDVRTYYQRKFHYVLVDEYQDTNKLQYMLTALLSGGRENLCVVGDDDQSIYRFRGATIENILDFEKNFPGARVIRMEQNYRSTQSILNAANAVIANNIGRKGKRLWTLNGQGAPITVFEAGDESQEANYVARCILSATKNGNFKDHAILYRTNAQSNALEYALKRNGIDYKVIGGMRFFDRAEVKDMLSYLCVINNRSDDLRLNRIINNPPRGLGSKTLETVRRLATAEGCSVYRVVSDPGSYAPLEKSAGKLAEFSKMIEDLAGLLKTDISLEDFYEEVMHRTGYIGMLESKPTEENKTRLENIRELKSSIKLYVQDAEQPTLAGFLEEIALYTDLDQYESGDDKVVLMTMHAAKGLEFPHVYLVGFEDGLFPGMRAVGDREEMEEERRLCYVAITRAKKTLTITYARQRMLFGRTTPGTASRFLREIPLELTDRKAQYVTPQSGYVRPAPPQMSRKTVLYEPPKSQPLNFLELKRGDMVEHSSFGKGMVLSVMKMGSDALWEIVFDEKGTRKLMARTATTHMKKL